MEQLEALVTANLDVLQAMRSDPLLLLEGVLLASSLDAEGDLFVNREWTAQEVSAALQAFSQLLAFSPESPTH